ncbi:MAG: hypothetical protein ABI592_12650 [Acidobacteriota bacterium]
MKRAPLLLAILFLGALGASAAPREPQRFSNPLLDDVVEMTNAEVPDATVLAFLRARRSRLGEDVTAQDLIRLHRAGVADAIVAYIAGEAGLDAHSEEETSPSVAETPPEPDRDASNAEPVPVDDGGLVSGVYDPIPINDYPCWPPGWWSYSDACGGPVFVGGGEISGGIRFGGRGRRREAIGTKDGRDDGSGPGSPRGDRPERDRGDRGDRGRHGAAPGGVSHDGHRSSPPGGGHGRH